MVFRVSDVAIPRSIGAFSFADVRPVWRKWHPAAFGGPVCVWLHGMIKFTAPTAVPRVPWNDALHRVPCRLSHGMTRTALTAVPLLPLSHPARMKRSRQAVWLTRSYRIPTLSTLSCPLFCRGVGCFCGVVQTVKAAARTVTLSADPSLVSSALAKGTAFDLRSLKPGMLVETIVDSVLSNGILVSPVQTL